MIIGGYSIYGKPETAGKWGVAILIASIVIPISICFLTVLSNQIISHIQIETFCSEIFTYFLPEICK